jgi:hypothetical protein
MYGGACGGGKSDAILMAALMYALIKGYSAIIFRKTFTDLSMKGALIERSHEWLDDTDAKWDNVQHCWNFPSGAKLQFAYLEHIGDEKRYKSAEFHFVGFDQVEEIPEEQYKFLFSRARRLKNSYIPIRVWSTANPDGLPWVKQRFLTEHNPDRAFIPAKLSDNPALDQEDYIKSLDNLDPIHREQLLNGNWDVTPGGKLLQRSWFTNNLVDLKDVPLDSPRLRMWDIAATAPAKGKDPDWTVGTLCTLKNGDFYIIDVVRFRKSPNQTRSTMKETVDSDELTVTHCMEEEAVQVVKSY